MKVVVKESTLVKPADELPPRKVWNSSLDLTNLDTHTPTVYFYRPNGAPNFFDTKVLKDALSRTLVAFYPLAGRFKPDQNGRVEIDCQGQGVVFLEAESDNVIDDFGEFAPTLEYMKLIPPIDYSMPIESIPLVVFQVTSFKCGGFSIGAGMHHRVVDGPTAFHFVSTWSDLARGLDITLPPFIDRTLLRPRDAPRPVFEHLEYQPDPKPLQAPKGEIKTPFSTFKLTRTQLDTLKKRSKEDGNTTSYTTFEILSAHIWKCVCKARDLPNDAETKLYVPVDGRARLQPPLPPGYFGNVSFEAAVKLTAGDIQSKPTWYVASKIREAIARMNNDYLRSALDYLEQNNCQKPFVNYKDTNLRINSWVRLPFHEIDFGWGRPVYMGRVGPPSAGRCYVLPSSINDGSLRVMIGLEVEQLKLFGDLLYAI